MIKKESILNYFLILGFILVLVIFLSSIVLISRFVLSDVTPLGKHVQNTKDLLQDINEVEASTQQNENSSDITLNYDEIFIRKNHKIAEITNIARVNVNENKTIITMFIKAEVQNIDNIYFEIVKDPSSLTKGDMLIYGIDKKEGSFVSIEDDLLIIYDFKNKRIEKISRDDFIGKIILIV